MANTISSFTSPLSFLLHVKLLIMNLIGNSKAFENYLAELKSQYTTSGYSSLLARIKRYWPLINSNSEILYLINKVESVLDKITKEESHYSAFAGAHGKFINDLRQLRTQDKQAENFMLKRGSVFRRLFCRPLSSLRERTK